MGPITMSQISKTKRTNKNTIKVSKGKYKSSLLSGKRKTVAVILLFVIGAAILFYPTFSNLWNQRFAQRSIDGYNNSVKEIDKEEKKALIERAIEYNNILKTEVVPDAFAVRDGINDEKYEAQLAADESGIMGSIEIPVISVNLPVYHYTTNEVLEKGAGHLLGSSLPVGGEGTHTVITAHRGLPSMRLFTDLDLIKKGDEFYIHVLGEHYAYEVDQIITVLPEQTEALALKKGKDYATLITCTPYGKNTHRLFVRGHRIPYVPKNVESRASLWRDLPWWARILAAVLGLIIAYVVLLPLYRKRRGEEDKEHSKKERLRIPLGKKNEEEKKNK